MELRVLVETSGQLASQEARRNGLQKLVLTCIVFLLCYLTAELGGILVMHVPQPIWLLWPGCAILTAVLLLSSTENCDSFSCCARPFHLWCWRCYLKPAHADLVIVTKRPVYALGALL